MSARILLVGGGTGGHVFPLIALAEAFGRLAPQIELRFVGSARGVESKLVPARGFVLDLVPAEPLKGRSVFGLLRGGAFALAGLGAASKMILAHRPQLVVSVGGYAAGPVSLAAATLGVPLALLEPNRIVGLTQRLLTPLARRVYLGFAESLAALGSHEKKGRAMGVPLRAGFAPSPCKARGEQEPLRILVLGGSQGAEHINRVLPAAIARLARSSKGSSKGSSKVEVLHQAGPGRADDVRRGYAQAFDAEAARAVDEQATEDDLERARRKGPGRVPVEVVDFIDDMEAKIERAHLVVSRSGAGSCAEICAIGRPAILVPYPHAADDHQSANAAALVAAGAAIAIAQPSASAEAICEALRDLGGDDARRVAMGEAARARGAPDAAASIARDLLALIGVEPAKAAGPRAQSRGEVR